MNKRKRCGWKMITTLCIVLPWQLAWAQLPEEWLQQDRTKIQRLVEQLLANRLYQLQLKKGYSIAGGSLQDIASVRNRDFRQHRERIDSLSVVRPLLKVMDEVQAFARLAAALVQQLRAVQLFTIMQQALVPAEVEGINKTLTRIQSSLQQTLGSMVLLLQDHYFQMPDEDRLRRIHELYCSLQEQRSATAMLYNDIHLLCLQRISTQTEIDHFKRIQ